MVRMKGYVYAVTVIGPMEEKKASKLMVNFVGDVVNVKSVCFNANDHAGGNDQGNSEVGNGIQEEAAWQPEGRRRWKTFGDFCKSSS